MYAFDGLGALLCSPWLTLWLCATGQGRSFAGEWRSGVLRCGPVRFGATSSPHAPPTAFSLMALAPGGGSTS
eukprot:12607501-Alexandrium_andersonii.AAC.1